MTSCRVLSKRLGNRYEETVKALCPKCDRLVPLELFRMEGRSLLVTCPKCGAETSIDGRPVSGPPKVSLASTGGGSNVVVLRTQAADAVLLAAQAAEENPLAIPEGLCSKCFAPRTAAPACAQCGSTHAQFDVTTVEPPGWLMKEWLDVLHNWGDEDRHAQVLRAACQGDALASLGRLYRLRQAFTPEDPVARKGVSEVLRLASIPPRAAADAQPRQKPFVLMGLVVLLMLLLFLALMMMNQNTS